jgi:hypothetical protein
VYAETGNFRHLGGIVRVRREARIAEEVRLDLEEPDLDETSAENRGAGETGVK